MDRSLFSTSIPEEKSVIAFLWQHFVPARRRELCQRTATAAAPSAKGSHRPRWPQRRHCTTANAFLSLSHLIQRTSISFSFSDKLNVGKMLSTGVPNNSAFLTSTNSSQLLRQIHWQGPARLAGPTHAVCTAARLLHSLWLWKSRAAKPNTKLFSLQTGPIYVASSTHTNSRKNIWIIL